MPSRIKRMQIKLKRKFNESITGLFCAPTNVFALVTPDGATFNHPKFRYQLMLLASGAIFIATLSEISLLPEI